jgi:hypothetical protein
MYYEINKYGNTVLGYSQLLNLVLIPLKSLIMIMIFIILRIAHSHIKYVLHLHSPGINLR